MVMKDKLYKSNHKGIYYKTRKALITSAVVISGFACVSVPTYINYKNEAQAKAEIEVKKDEKSKIEIVVSHELEHYEDESIYVSEKTADIGKIGSITEISK